MKQTIFIIAIVSSMVSLTALGFTLNQIYQRQESLVAELGSRTSLLADSFKESVRTPYLLGSTTTVQNIMDKFAGRERLLGIAVHDASGQPFAFSAGTSGILEESRLLAEAAMDSNEPVEDFLVSAEGDIFAFSVPLRSDGRVIGALTVYQRAGYIDQAIDEIWRINIVRLIVQIAIFALAILLVLRMAIQQPAKRLAESMRMIRSGEGEWDPEEKVSGGFFKPLISEIGKMTKVLARARTTASEEARMRLEQADSTWTAERLKEFFKAYLRDRQIFIVSNREPYVHAKRDGGIVWQVPASGMVTALEPVLEACGGMWIAHGSGDADRQTVDTEDKIQVPPDDPKYTLKRVWLSDKEVAEYYNGFSNEALWPLCLHAHNRPLFRKQDWETYYDVNKKFAASLLNEIKEIDRPMVLVQDYHFALLPKMIKDARSDVEVGMFWHIPWPSAEVFGICPWRKEIIEGMLGSDILGFHTQQHCNNFMETVNREIEAIVNLDEFSIIHAGHSTHVKPFPISVAFTNGVAPAAVEADSEILRKFIAKGQLLGVGVDRMDYAKGLMEKLKGLEFFFGTYPEYIGKMTFLQIASPSRAGVRKYRQFSEEVNEEVVRINKRFEKGAWKPIVILNEHYSHGEIYKLYAAADFCLVTSLSDGMNLVAKEFVASRNDADGVLILSKFAGASRSLKGAIVINPYSAEETAEAIHQALVMTDTEKRRRMAKMRQIVKNYNIYRWAAEFLKSLSNLS